MSKYHIDDSSALQTHLQWLVKNQQEEAVRKSIIKECAVLSIVSKCLLIVAFIWCIIGVSLAFNGSDYVLVLFSSIAPGTLGLVVDIRKHDKEQYIRRLNDRNRTNADRDIILSEALWDVKL